MRLYKIYFLLYKKSQTNNRNNNELTSDIFIFALRVTKIKNDEYNNIYILFIFFLSIKNKL